MCQLACDGWTWGEDAPRPEADGSPFAIQVLGTKECPVEETVNPDDELPSPPLGVELRITGWDPGGTPVNFYYAHLEDSAGATYAAQAGCEPLLEGLPLAPGKRTQGYVSFSVPPDGGPYTLVYEPRLVDASGSSHRRRATVPLGKHP